MRIAVIDIGGTAIKSGVYVNGTVTEKRECPTEAEQGAAHVIERVGDIVLDCEGVEAVGISTTGQIDTLEGKVVFAGPNIPGYSGFEIKKILEGYLHLPVAIENDVNAAALGEAYYGAGRGVNNFLCLTYGTGIGGAVIFNGDVYHGHNFAAGEFGAIVVHPENRNQEDIFSGCYERYASVNALVEKAMEVDPALNSGRAIFARIEEAAVKKLVHDWTKEVAVGLATLIQIFNPALVLLGGGIMDQPMLLPMIRKELDFFIMDSHRDVVLKSAMLGNDAGLYGVADLAFHSCKRL